MLLNVEKIELIKKICNEKLLKNKKIYWNTRNLKNYRKGLIIMECREYRIKGSCDICHKNSSYGNRTCNKCFYKLIGENNEM